MRSHYGPFLQRPCAPLERYALGLICLQGGGLDISDTATLTNTNVYSNQVASAVRSFFNLLYDISFIAPMELDLLSRLAGRWRLYLFQRSG